MPEQNILGIQNNIQANFFDNDWSDDIIYSEEEEYWNKLIDKIIAGNVIPVIGAEMLVENCHNIHQTIIECVARKLNIAGNFTSFSELVYNKSYHEKIDEKYHFENTDNKYQNEIDVIYSYVDAFLTQTQKRLIPSYLLKKLLSYRQFPFVITTSFTPVVENTMREIWGDDLLRILNFSNSPMEIEDIKDESDTRCPTVYYMFGKHTKAKHQYVLTDTDMLDFCSTWLSDSPEKKPKNLVSALSNKYLLMIGNNYSDWLFRFIWYSLRKGKLGNGMLAYDEVEDSFLHFLDRTNASSRQNPVDVVEQIEKRLTAKLQENENTRFNKAEQNADIFISYSHRDKPIADKLYTALSQMGERVWYDRNGLAGGSIFMDDIKKAVKTARYFIPLFTENIINERNDSHVYRVEWDTAIDVATSMGRTYIIPLAFEDFDFYNARIPERIQRHNAVIFNNNTDWNEIAKQILHVMNQN